MIRAITAFLLTVFVGYLGLELGVSQIIRQYPEFGSIFAIAFMGALIIYYTEKEKK